MKYILILFIAIGCNQKTAQPVTVPTNTAQAPAPSTVPNPNIKVNFKDLTIAQFEQLNAMLDRTTYKDSADIQPETVMNTKQVDAVLAALSTLPYKEVAGMINLLYDSGVRQVKEQTAVK